MKRKQTIYSSGQRSNKKGSRLSFIKEIDGTNIIFDKNGYSWIVRRALWQCDCGNIHEANITSVMHGNTKSCGCLRNQKETPQKATARMEYKIQCAIELIIAECDLDIKTCNALQKLLKVI